MRRLTHTFHISDMALKLAGSILIGSFLGNGVCRKMTTLQYPVKDELTVEGQPWYSARYTNGWDDLYFVGFWIIAFTYIRIAIMQSWLNPLGKKLGIRGSKLERFEEQGYIIFYYVISWTCGMVSNNSWHMMVVLYSLQ
jgi:acyl-CoA-dependent ceramide synthase